MEITAREMLLTSKETFLKNHPEMTSDTYEEIMHKDFKQAFQEIYDSFLEVKPVN